MDESAQQGRVWGGEPSHPQMPKSAFADSSPKMALRSLADARVNGNLVHSHGHILTSIGYGFNWVSLQLQEALEEKRCWDDSTKGGGGFWVG